MKIAFDTRQFSKALTEYQKATKKDMPDVLNRAGKNVAFRAAQFTPMATAAKIRQDLKRDPHLVYALTSIALKNKGIGALQSPKFAAEVKKFINKRVGSRGFIRSGWAPAIEQLGGSYRGRKVGKSHGWARRASIVTLVTEIANLVPGIEQEGKQALQRAINFVADDMTKYAEKLMARRGKEYGY